MQLEVIADATNAHAETLFACRVDHKEFFIIQHLCKPVAPVHVLVVNKTFRCGQSVDKIWKFTSVSTGFWAMIHMRQGGVGQSYLGF